jgi:tetratricopeptide (TPR) repeat protein
VTRRLTVVLISFVLVVGLFSSSVKAEPLEEGNRLYANGQYAEAADVYSQLSRVEPYPEVFYNSGNAYFKDEKLGLAVLNYERARALAPRDRDIRFNLDHATRQIEYEIKDKRSWAVLVVDQLLSRVTFSECVLATMGSYFVFVVIGIATLVRRKSLAIGAVGVTALTMTLVLASLTALKFTNLGARTQAIVTERQSEVRYGPASGDRLAFRLVEGLKVTVKGEKPGWYRIELLDGQSGWTPQSQITVI